MKDAMKDNFIVNLVKQRICENREVETVESMLLHLYQLTDEEILEAIIKTAQNCSECIFTGKCTGPTWVKYPKHCHDFTRGEEIDD